MRIEWKSTCKLPNRGLTCSRELTSSLSPLPPETLLYSFILVYFNQKGSEMKVAQLCPTLCNPKNCSPWNSSGQNTGVGSLFQTSLLLTSIMGLMFFMSKNLSSSVKKII